MDESGNVLYKYNCRKCPIRNRCIEESDNSPITKVSLRNSFENKTDTLGLWANLQPNCLLLKSEQQSAEAKKESLLSRRLRLARETKQGQTARNETESPETPAENTNPKTAPVAPPPPQPQVQPRPASQKTPYPMPGIQSDHPLEIRDPDQLTKKEILDARSSGERFWLTVKSSSRHISLPTDGELILGRFDPNFGIPPDVDLTFEDAGSPSISRRHARIEGKGGLHTIQEMGSRSGVMVNGQKTRMGQAHRLNSGDLITLGRCDITYEPVPKLIRKPDFARVRGHILMVTGTGRRFGIRPGTEQIVGRSDKYVNFTPDIDLAGLDKLAGKVSRRHARLSFKPGNPVLHIEDMGSGFGTKINGKLVMLGDSVPLKPGDHIWLGGCVLAYDIIY